MDLADQCGKDMAIGEIEIVAGSIEIIWHGRDEIAVILTAIGLSQLDPSDLGNCIPLVGGLQRAGQQRVFGHWLRGLPRINAG